MATPGGLVDKQELIDAQLDTAHLGRVVNSKDAGGNPINSSTNRLGGVNKTLDALQAEYQEAIQAAGGVPLGTWTSGVTEFNAYNEYAVYNGVPYKPRSTTTLPYTAQGADPTASPDNAFVQPYVERAEWRLDDKSRQESTTGSQLDIDSAGPFPTPVTIQTHLWIDDSLLFTMSPQPSNPSTILSIDLVLKTVTFDTGVSSLKSSKATTVSNGVIVFESVSSMVSGDPSFDYAEGMLLKTRGRITSNDGGGAEYVVGTSSGVISGTFEIDLGGGLSAFLKPSGFITVRQLGAQAGTDIVPMWDDFISYSAALGVESIVDGDEDYLVSDTVSINKSGITLTFTGGAFLQLTQSTSIGGILIIGDTTFTDFVDDIVLNNPQIDGGNIGHPTAAAFGENGVGGTNCRRVRINGGKSRRCRRGTNPFGGKGIQFENGVYDIKVDGFTSEDCTIGMESGGTPNDVNPPLTPSDFHTATLVTYTNMTCVRCDKMISLIQSNSPPVADVDVSNFVIDGVTGFDCGRNSIAGTELDAGPIVIDRAQNYSITNVNIFNTPAYGSVSSIVRSKRAGHGFVEAELWGECEHIASHLTPEGGGTSGQLIDNIYKLRHHGSAKYAIDSETGDTANLVNNSYDITTDTITLALSSPRFKLTTSQVKFTDITKKITIEGQANQVASQLGDTYPTASGRAGSYLVNKVLFTFGAGNQTLTSFGDENLTLSRNLSERIVLKTVGYASKGLPTYADNAAALVGGLVIDDEYKTATGERRIVV